MCECNCRQLSDEEIAKIAFRAAVKNLDGIDLPDDFPIVIKKRADGCEAFWPPNSAELLRRASG